MISVILLIGSAYDTTLVLPLHVGCVQVTAPSTWTDTETLFHQINEELGAGIMQPKYETFLPFGFCRRGTWTCFYFMLLYSFAPLHLFGSCYFANEDFKKLQ